MKKIIILSMIAFVAAGIIGCTPKDETKADLRWKNNSNAALVNISWSSNGSSDQTWASVGDTADATTEYKGIKELAGTGDAVFATGGTAVLDLTTNSSTDVIYASGSAATIKENGAATLNINGAAAK